MRTRERARERVATAPRSKAAKFDQAVGRLMSEINLGAASAERDGWVDESAILSEFEVAQ